MDRYAITGMTCQHCVRAVEAALSKVRGVTGVLVDLERGVATVEGTATEPAVVAAVREEGYEARRM